MDGEVSYFEEYEYFKELEDSYGNNDVLFQRDAIIVLNVPIELKMVLSKIRNSTVVYDFLEYTLRACTDVVRNKFTTRDNHLVTIHDKIVFYITNYMSSYDDVAKIKMHMETVVNSIDTLCGYLISGMKKYGLDSWYFLLIERPDCHNDTEVLDNILEVSLCVDNGEAIETP